MKNEIIRKQLLTTITIIVAGGLTFAVPGVVPSAHAQQADVMSVSAVNEMFGNSFVGGQVVEVSVNSPQFRADNAFEDALEPIVTVDDNPLVMMQAFNGIWYGYFVDANMAAAAHENGLDYGTMSDDMTFNNGADALYVNDGTRNVLADPDLPKSGIVIQAFVFGDATDIDIELENGSGSETVTLTFGTVGDYASLALDRDTAYPLGSHVHVTITDVWMNIDPTAEDEWVLTGDDKRFYRVTSAQLGDLVDFGEPVREVPKDDLMCDDNCVFNINTGQQGETILFQQDNDVSLDDVGMLGPMAITFAETNANTGIFTNTDDFDASNLITTDDISLDGKTATITYNGNDTSIVIDIATPSQTILPSQTARQYEFLRPLALDMDPYIWFFDVVEVEMMLPYDNLVVGDVIAYILPDSGDAADGDSNPQHTVKRIVDKRFGVWVTQPDDPEYASNFDLVSENEYVGLVNAVMECMPSDLLYDDGRVSAIVGTRVVTELPDGSIDRSWAGKWIEDLFGYCDLSTAPIDTQARYMEQYIDPTG